MEPNIHTIEHARISYENTKDIIKFIDTKTGVLIGLITLTTAFPLIIFQWVAERDQHSEFALEHLCVQSAAACEFFLFGSLLCMAAGAWAVFVAMQGLIARKPPEHKETWLMFFKGFLPRRYDNQDETNSKLTFLFPMHGRRHQKAASKFFPKLLNGLSDEEILSEYAYQLEHTGAILGEKVNYLRYSVRMLQIQVFAYILSLGIPYVILRW